MASTSGAPTRARPLDPLSDVLNTVRLSGAVFFSMLASRPWDAGVPDGSTIAPVVAPGARHIVSYHVLMRGRCWANLLYGEADPVELEAGDILVLPQGDAYWMSLEAVPPRHADSAAELSFLARMASGEAAPCVQSGGGGAEGVELLCGFLGCDLEPFNPLLQTLPRLLCVRSQDAEGDPRLSQLTELARAEAFSPRAGGDCVRLRLSELLFVEILCRHLAALPKEQASWLGGLRDPQVGRALALLHEHLADPWTLDELARRVGVSRSVLAERFLHFVGDTPMQYLAKWRMQVAARQLADGSHKVAAVAESVGYGSEAAFSRAFKKLTGVAPSSWRKHASGTADPAPG